MKKCIVAVCIAAIGVVAFIPASASATTFGTRLTIGIMKGGRGFGGTAKSSSSSCVANRQVTLQRRKVGQDKYKDIGTDKTSSSGSWVVHTLPVNRAKYRAVAKRERTSTDTCRRGSSNRTKAHKTKVTIVPLTSSFIGKVFSYQPCVGHRRVLLQRKGSHGKTFGTIGADRANKDGEWRVNKTAVHGSSYRAMARAKQVGARTSCMRRASPTFHG